MVKRAQYTSGYKDWGYGYTYSRIPMKDRRTIVAVNVKAGFDVRLSRSGRSRFEMFTGLGLRYQSVGINYNVFSKGTYTDSQFSPSIVGGAALKF
ncbi:hypothetical protein GCM10023189_50420 [Nibrella saemangeumensis]|uniref:Outer membrane protein beta-barrel domain-containing protein n=1 Tax=Nibrella saemangeumensis TaxID=1084526 RepID=A0ABP8NH05_9BACT